MNETKITNSSVPPLRLVTKRIFDILVFFSRWSVTLFKSESRETTSDWETDQSGFIFPASWFKKKKNCITVYFRFATTVP